MSGARPGVTAALKHSSPGVCTRTSSSSLRFPADRARVPSRKLQPAGAAEKPSAGTQGRLAEEPSLQGGKCRCLTVQGSLAENLSSSPIPRWYTVICNS